MGKFDIKTVYHNEYKRNRFNLTESELLEEIALVLKNKTGFNRIVVSECKKK